MVESIQKEMQRGKRQATNEISAWYWSMCRCRNFEGEVPFESKDQMRIINVIKMVHLHSPFCLYLSPLCRYRQCVGNFFVLFITFLHSFHWLWCARWYSTFVYAFFFFCFSQNRRQSRLWRFICNGRIHRLMKLKCRQNETENKKKSKGDRVACAHLAVGCLYKI